MSQDETVEEYTVDHPHRRKLPKKRKSRTYAFQIQDLDVYMHVGLYEDGTPGEIFLTGSKGTFGAFIDAFSVAISMSLQYGTPLESLCAKFIGWKFEPNGQVYDMPDIKTVESILDYIFVRLARDFLTPHQQEKVGAL